MLSDDDFYDGDDFAAGDADDDDDDDDDDAGLAASFGAVEGRGARQRSYQVLTQAQVLTEVNRLSDEVQSVLSVARPVAIALLRTAKWNKERVVERYLDDAKRALRDAGFSSTTLKYKVPSTKKKQTCLVCYDDFSSSKLYALCCGHAYCYACWRQYLELRIAAGSECIFSTCINPRCSELVHEDAFRALVTKEQYASYDQHLYRSYVNDNPHIKHCPAPGCSHSVRCDLRSRVEAVVCTCGFRWCFNCADAEIGDHLPASCAQVEQWREKAADESENVTWMMANTKKCPQCRSPIEKNGGCMHMQCRRNFGGCGHEFCWLCRGAWSEHGSHTGGYYNCNRYETSTAKGEDAKSTDIKTELEYYMWHFHRFDAHRAAHRIAGEQRALAEKRGATLQSTLNVREADVKFLADATEQLRANRRALMWSYTYGYYLDKKKHATEANLFLYLQEDLEKHTNHLSELYETPSERIATYQQFVAWKEDVTNYTRVTAKFLDSFVEGVVSGLSKPNHQHDR